MGSKHKKNRGIKRLVRLGLIDKPDGPGKAVGAELKAALRALEELSGDIDLGISLSVRARQEPAAAEAAWIDVVNSLPIKDQLRVLHLSAVFGPNRGEAGRRILDRHEHAGRVERELINWVSARGGDPSGVEVTYSANDATYCVDNGQSPLCLDYLNDYGLEAAKEHMEDLLDSGD